MGHWKTNSDQWLITAKNDNQSLVFGKWNWSVIGNNGDQWHVIGKKNYSDLWLAAGNSSVHSLVFGNTGLYEHHSISLHTIVNCPNLLSAPIISSCGVSWTAVLSEVTNVCSRSCYIYLKIKKLVTLLHLPLPVTDIINCIIRRKPQYVVQCTLLVSMLTPQSTENSLLVLLTSQIFYVMYEC